MRPDPYGEGVVFRTLSKGSKQNRIVHDAVRKRNLLFGGDYANALGASSAAAMTWAYDPVADVVKNAANRGITLVAKRCSGPGNVDPGTPNDSQACGMDYQLDCLWVNEGGWFGSAHGDACNSAGNAQIPSVPGSTLYHGLMRMNANTGIWTGVSTAVRQFGVLNGHFDPVKRCLVGVSGSPSISQVFVEGMPSVVNTPIVAGNIGCVARPPGKYFAGGNEVSGHDWAMDIIGRWGYVVSTYKAWPTGASDYDHYENVFWRFSLDTPSIQQKLPDPPFGSPTTYTTHRACGPFSIHLSWDSRNRKVVWFYSPTTGCAMIRGIGVYDPVTNAWDTLPVLQTPNVGLRYVCSNAIGYDSTNNVHVLYGSVFCPEDAVETAAGITGFSPYYMLWRYA
jgi:hypothetical protein